MSSTQRSSGLSRERGITHELSEILENWLGAEAGLLVVDALDAARKSETQNTLGVVIEEVLYGAAGRWNVVASVRSYDLRQGIEWARMFRGSLPTPSFIPSFFLP